MTPEQEVRELLEQAEQQTTPCGSGVLRWQQWEGPKGRRPLVLLHGGFGSWTHWIANIRELSKHRTLWTLDLPGLGHSADMPEPHTAEHFATIVLKGLDSLRGAKREFDLAGFSFGGLVGAYLAAEAGSRCKHFIAIGAAGFGDLHVQVDLQRPPTFDMPTDQAASIHRTNLRTLMFSSNDVIDELAVYVHGGNLARNRFNSRKLARSSDILPALPRIKARLCGIWGTRDATAGGRAAIEKRRDLFREVQPDCNFHILDGVGHWVMYEEPETFSRLLLEELAD